MSVFISLFSHVNVYNTCVLAILIILSTIEFFQQRNPFRQTLILPRLELIDRWAELQEASVKLFKITCYVPTASILVCSYPDVRPSRVLVRRFWGIVQTIGLQCLARLWLNLWRSKVNDMVQGHMWKSIECRAQCITYLSSCISTF